MHHGKPAAPRLAADAAVDFRFGKPALDAARRCSRTYLHPPEGVVGSDRSRVRSSRLRSACREANLFVAATRAVPSPELEAFLIAIHNQRQPNNDGWVAVRPAV